MEDNGSNPGTLWERVSSDEAPGGGSPNPNRVRSLYVTPPPPSFEK